MSNTEHNKTLVRQCFERTLKGDTEGLREILSPDFVIHTPEDYRGPEGLQEMAAPFKAGLPDLRITIDAQFADGDYVATRFRAQGTHNGDLFGVPASGREVTVYGITVSCCRDGRIEEEWEQLDALGALQQVGALPAMAEA
ncbi:MAG: ester cyclase [Gaiellaceae bacterium]